MKLDSFYVETYRGLKEVSLDKFTDINVFVGKNNSGKTSLLEAMVLSGLFDNAEQMIITLASRYQKVSIDRVNTMFDINGEKKRIGLKHCLYDEGAKEHMQIDTEIVSAERAESTQQGDGIKELRRLALRLEYNTCCSETGKKQTAVFRIDFLQEGAMLTIRSGKRRNSDMLTRIPCQFVAFSRFDGTDFLLKALDEILEQGKRADLVEALQIFDESIQNFEIIGEERDIKIIRDGDNAPLSVYDYGNGMYKAFYIASAALLSENGILLVDEIEAGIHREALEKFVRYLGQLCQKKKIQMFVTTHSLETLDLFLQSCQQADRVNDLTVYNIRNTKEKTNARRYSGSKLKDLRTDIGLDVR